MIPVIMKGETSKPIQLALKEGYEYSGCALHVNFCGLRDTFVDLAAGGSVELRYTAAQTARLPLGTSKVMLSIENARNEICFMPWAKIKVTDCPEDVRDAQITIDPATLNVEDLTTKDTLASVKSRMNAVMAFLRRLSSLAILILPLYALSDVAPLTAPLDDIPGDTPIMTNVVPYVDAKVASVPEPDYSTGNAALVATIEATAPAPGNYETVSNRAMSALQKHQSLWPAVAASTNYTDAALGTFASTGAVARATVYGTPTRWTDATGCVWEVQTTRVCTNANEEWAYTMDGQTYTREQMIEAAGGDEGYSMILDWEDSTFINKDGDNEEFEGWYVLDGSGTAPVGYNYSTGLIPSYASDPYLAQVTYYGNITATRGDLVTVTNLVARVALTNDIPAIPAETDPTVPAWAKAQNKPTYTAVEVGATDGEAVTNIVRGMSLCGIWDDKLGVWWTPHMSGGAYYWTATTNVNLSAEGNQ